MITFNKVDSITYKHERLDQPFKYKNGIYIDKFNSVIEEAIQNLDIDGIISYKNGDSKDNITKPFLYYNYGSPAPWLGKLLPSGYGFLFFEPNDIYKKCETEYGIQHKLLKLYDSGKFTRYPQPKLETTNLPNNYILVCMQNTGSTVWYKKDFTKLANDIVSWSRENKKYVIFKWHNGCVDHNNPQRWFSELNEKSEYARIDYSSPLWYLIKNCDMMWTASSMAGIEALICNKPVAVFGMTEYMEMATVCDNPDQAIKATIPLDLEQWLTYYVKYYCINIYASDAVKRVKDRITNHFQNNFKLHELILYK